MLTPALNAYSPRFSAPRLPSSSVRRLNHSALSMTPARSSCSAMLPPSSSRTIMTTLSAASGPGLRDSFISQASAPTVASAPSSTKVRSPLTLERPIRRGLRGGCGGPGGAAAPSAGLVARPNRLTRGRGASPSPELSSPLMSLAVTALPPSLQTLVPRGAGRAGPRAQGKFSRRAAVAKQRIAAGLRSVQSRGRRATRWCRRIRTSWTAPRGSDACAPHAAQDRSPSRPRGCRD